MLKKITLLVTFLFFLLLNLSVFGDENNRAWMFLLLNSPGSSSCDSSHLNQCTTEKDCTDAAGNWWSDNTCNGSLEPSQTDCNGDIGGSAYIDMCGNCVGGDTGATACVDNDGDGYWGSDDCNDDDNTIHPWATELCGDGIDQDCRDGDCGDIFCEAYAVKCSREIMRQHYPEYLDNNIDYDLWPLCHVKRVNGEIVQYYIQENSDWLDECYGDWM